MRWHDRWRCHAKPGCQGLRWSRRQIVTLNEPDLRIATPDDIVDSQGRHARDPHAIDPGSIGRLQITQQPIVTAWHEFGVAAADATIRKRQGFAGAAQQLGFA